MMRLRAKRQEKVQWQMDSEPDEARNQPAPELMNRGRARTQHSKSEVIA